MAASSELADNSCAQRSTHLSRHLVITGLVLACMAVLPVDIGGILFVVYAIYACAAGWQASRGRGPDVRHLGGTVALTGVVFLVGGVVRAVEAIIRGVDYPFPAFADLFSLAAFGLFIYAIYFVVRRRNPHLSLDPVIDALVGVVAVGIIQWTVIMLPYIKDPTHTQAEVLVTVGFGFVSLATIGMAVLALVAGSVPSTSNRLLAAGLVMAFASDVMAVTVTGGAGLDRVLGLVNASVVALGSAGLLHPSIKHLFDRPNDMMMTKRLSRRRVVVLSFALITPPAVLTYEVLSGARGVELMLPALGSLVLAPLVLVRLGRLVRENERLASQQRALRELGESLVEASTNGDIAMVLEAGVRSLFGELLLDTRFVHADGRVDSERASALRRFEELSAEGPVGTGDIRELGCSENSGCTYGGAVVLDGELRAVLCFSIAGELTQDERNAMAALCRQGTIAMRAAERTEELVRERAERRFGTLIENSSDIVAILDAGNHLLYTSPVARRLLGAAPQVGFEFRVDALVHPQDRSKAESLLQEARDEGYATAEVRLAHTNGTHLWFEVQATNLLDDPDVGGILINARAVDDRKAAEELLLLSEARFKSLVQNNTDLVMVVDPDDRITYASPSAVAMVGEHPDALFGRPLSSVFNAADLDWPAILRQWASQGRTNEFGFARAGSGEWLTFEAMVTDLRGEPSVGGFVFNARDVTERNRMQQKITHQSTHDSLTGMPNRVLLLDDLERMLGHNSGNSSVSAVCIDLDNFRDINENLGQEVGDEVLIAVSQRIASALSFGDQAARIGADEFAVVVERAHGEDSVMEMTESILAQLALPFEIDGRQLTLTASAGVAVDHDRGDGAEVLLSNSITAMHQAKQDGRGRAVRFESAMRTASSNRLEIRGDLARAIGTEQIVVNYQPVVNLENHAIVGAEALVRWDHPERGRLSPGLFVPIAEEYGLIDALDAQVRAQACRDLAEWRSEMPAAASLTVSVNLSVGELQADDLVETVLQDLAVNDLPPDALVLEVTESHLLDDSDNVRTKMEQLRAQGIRLAIDDFGTGYSSLGYIDRFEFDVLKIDRSFVAGIGTATNQRIIAAVLDLAKQLNARVIAEGIEESAQEEQLHAMGCGLGQGYLYSRPVGAEQMRRMLLGTSAIVA